MAKPPPSPRPNAPSSPTSPTSPTVASSSAATPSSAQRVLDRETVDALQRALAVEHAAVWTCGLVTAFLGAPLEAALAEASAAHRARRDTTDLLLRDAGAVPVPAEPAYLPPQPVTDQASALGLLAMSENDGAAAWRAVLERTDDVELRRAAREALTGSAVRATRWRKAAGAQPLTTPFPGQP